MAMKAETRVCSSLRHMFIGDTFTWHGSAYVVRGVDPIGTLEPGVHLQDPATGEWVRVLLDEIAAEAFRAERRERQGNRATSLTPEAAPMWRCE
jgi:hypothetical protein